MKISLYDRIQAIRFSPLYLKDYQRSVKKREQDGEIDIKVGPPWASNIHLSVAGKQLCEKWNLGYPVRPATPLEPGYYPKKAKRSFKEWRIEPPIGADVPFEPIDYETIKMLCEKWGIQLPREENDWILTPPSDYAWMIDGEVYPVSFPTEDELKKISRTLDTGGYRVVTHINGKLCLLIDTSRPRDEIIKVLKEFIKHHVNRTKARNKKTNELPWKIYNMYQKEKNLLKIAQSLHEFKELPAYNTDADKFYRRVERAYKKALKMIDYVEKEAKQKILPKITPPKTHSN